MSSLSILEEQPVTMVQLKEDLKKIKKRDEELNFRANKTEEYLNSFVTIKKTEAADLHKKITDLNIPRLKEEHLVKIIDLFPASVEELKAIMSGYTITISADNAKKIVDTVVAHAGKK